MPRLSTPETAATADDLAGEAVAADAGAADAGADGTPVTGASAVVEAATAEAAIAEVHERFGPGATIVEARRVLRGGIGGFFAKEHVQLHIAGTDPGAGARGGDAGGGEAGTGSVDARRGPVGRGDVAARAVALAAELTRGAAGEATVGGGAAASQDDTHLPGAGSGRGGAPGANSPVDRLLGRGQTPQDVNDADATDVDDTVDFGTFLRTQLARQGGGAGGADTEEAPPPTPQATAADTSAPAEAPTETAAARGPEREVQPMRWPGSHDPWSVYGVAATPDPLVEDARFPPVQPAQAAPEVSAVPVVTDGPVTEPAPAAAVADESDTTAPAAPVDGPSWSTTRLLHLGLPASLVHNLDVADPKDDLSWVAALTDALRPVCRPLPVAPAVLVGPDAPAIAEVVDLPVARSRTWLDALGANRWRHLVIGGQGWRSELTDEPLAVSWVRTDDLPDALRCAMELGLVLGYGPQGGQLRRARPLDVALAVRALVEQP